MHLRGAKVFSPWPKPPAAPVLLGRELAQPMYNRCSDVGNSYQARLSRRLGGVETYLRILKWQFTNDAETDWGLNESRGYACEYVAWQFLCHVNQRETIEFLLEELKTPMQGSTDISQAERGTSGFATMTGEAFSQEDERTPLLLSSSSSLYRFFGGKRRAGSSLDINEPGTNMSASDAYELEKLSRFFGLNALEIATIAQAKRFLSQKVVQKVIDNIWKGEIVFWDSLSVHSKKKPQFFNKR